MNQEEREFNIDCLAFARMFTDSLDYEDARKLAIQELKEGKVDLKVDLTDHSKCIASTGIHGLTTFGQGELDPNGFWEFPCYECARRYEAKYPDSGPCWPHTKEQVDKMGLRSLIKGDT